jgi:hypothetical protein
MVFIHLLFFSLILINPVIKVQSSETMASQKKASSASSASKASQDVLAHQAHQAPVVYMGSITVMVELHLETMQSDPRTLQCISASDRRYETDDVNNREIASVLGGILTDEENVSVDDIDFLRRIASSKALFHGMAYPALKRKSWPAIYEHLLFLVMKRYRILPIPIPTDFFQYEFDSVVAVPATK